VKMQQMQVPIHGPNKAPDKRFYKEKYIITH